MVLHYLKMCYSDLLKEEFKNWDSDEYDWDYNFEWNGHTNDDLIDHCLKYKHIWINDYLIYKLENNR